MKPSLRHLDDLRADPDNPRETDPHRLALVRLSLQKFGFLLPLVATAEGSLLSGHQRAREARALGFTHAPVLTTAPRSEGARRGLNILLNRATNDLRALDVRHDRIDVPTAIEMLAALPDASDPFACLRPRQVPVARLLAANPEPFDDHMVKVARSLDRAALRMPIVATGGDIILNGRGRLPLYAAGGVSAPVVVVDGEGRAAAAEVALNRLSMDFAFRGGSADWLRAHSFRRSRLERPALGSGFVFALWRGRLKDFDLRRHAAEWKRVYGTWVLDFGCGHGTEAAMLRRHGVKVTTFEPYPTAGERVDAKAGRSSALSFLRAVAAGVPFDGIFLSSVLNSVPFPADRRHLVTIVAALCGEGTTVFSAARSVADPGWDGVTRGGHLSLSSRARLQFPMAESGTVLGDFRLMPKVQKSFTAEEFADLFGERFEAVEIGRHINNVTAICRRPRALDRRALRAALAFEFDLPYPDGTRMGLAPRAIAAFGARLGVSP